MLNLNSIYDAIGGNRMVGDAEMDMLIRYPGNDVPGAYDEAQDGAFERMIEMIEWNDLV